MSDLISRQAAILQLSHNKCGNDENDIAVQHDIETIRNLPPALPEIVRCKDCKHWDGVDTCDVIDAPVWDNDFCSMAERRSDE